ncbi:MULTISPECIES: SNF2-related protein [Mesorhizobium]|uniref:SNF2-related protein n=1 Tax=Mesorhizobium TaxID=68287 RepID=UPI00145A01E2|nr:MULTISPECIES: SNF2-related protein [Mesorhizobium]
MNAHASLETYGRLRYRADLGKWQVAGLPPHVSLVFKKVFPRIPIHQTGEFFITDGAAVCADLVWFTQRYPLEVPSADRERVEAGRQRHIDQRLAVESLLADDWLPSSIGRFREGASPYPFQAQAAAVTAKTRRLLLLDDVGLGKTVSALATLAETSALPAAIVVQAHLAEQWVEEYIEEFTTFTSHIIKGTKPYRLPAADIFIFKYSNIAGWTDIAATGKFRSIIFDEIQELRHGGSTNKGQAARAFVSNTDIRMGLTATPIYNYGSEIFNIVDLLEPGALGGWHEFIIEWCTSHGSHWVVRDPKALGTYLRDQTIALRRTEFDVGKQMPPVNVLMHEVDFDQSVVDAVEDEARILAQRVMGGSFVERGQAARELDMMARHATGMAKAKSVAALARILVEAGEPVLLAGWHRDVYDVWLAALSDLDPVMYTGSETTLAKTRAKADFIEGRSKLMIISLRSGAGLDGLQRVCSKVIVGELDWSPQVHKQLIGRLRRPGQLRQVDAIYAHTNGGSDPVLVEMLGLKASQSQGIVDPLATLQQVDAPDDTRIKKLAQSYLAGVQS